MTQTRLYVFGGLPASGKTTLARHLSRHLGAVYLRIDTIEEAIHDTGSLVGPEGYEVAYRLAADNLEHGLLVVADSVNPIALTRQAWRHVATSRGLRCQEIEITCSDPAEHRRRLEARPSRGPGKKRLTWDDVLQRHYEAWEGCFCLDTAGQSPAQSQQQLLRGLQV